MNVHKFNRLIQRIKYDKKAIEEIYVEYYPRIILHLKGRFGKLISGPDIAQEVFVSLMSAELPKKVEYPTTWIFKIADNKAIDKIKKLNCEVPLYDNYSYESFELDRMIIKEDVKQLMKNINKEQQMILYMYLWEGYSHKEIAALLHISPANVRTKVSRAYAELKKYL